MRGAVRFGPSEIVFDDLAAELANGRLDGRLAFVTGPDGASVRANVELSNADAASIVGGDARRPPVAGKVTLRAEFEAAGRSPAAFIGSLAGTGTIALENAQLASLNPRVFDAVIRAVDLGIPTDANRIRDFVTTALENGTLPAAHAEAAITIAAGQARLSNIIARTSGADLSAAANVDLVEGALDAVLTLAGTPSQAGGARPTLSIALKGPGTRRHAPSMPTRWRAGWRCAPWSSRRSRWTRWSSTNGSGNASACCARRTPRRLRRCRRRLPRPLSLRPQ